MNWGNMPVLQPKWSPELSRSRLDWLLRRSIHHTSRPATMQPTPRLTMQDAFLRLGLPTSSVKPMLRSWGIRGPCIGGCTRARA